MSECEQRVSKLQEMLKSYREDVIFATDTLHKSIKSTDTCASYRDRYRSERNTCREKLSKYEPSAVPKNMVYGAPEEYNYKKNKSAWSAWETPSMVPELSASGSTLRNITNVQEPSMPPPRGGRKSRRSRNRKSRKNKNKSRRN
jgi:hypothetical protein